VGMLRAMTPAANGQESGQ